MFFQESKFRRNHVVMSDWVSVYVFYRPICSYIDSVLHKCWYKVALYSSIAVAISMNNCDIWFIILRKNSPLDIEKITEVSLYVTHIHMITLNSQ